MSRIAITALSLCFPGANDLDSYWRNLLAKNDSRSTGGVRTSGSTLSISGIVRRMLIRFAGSAAASSIWTR